MSMIRSARTKPFAEQKWFGVMSEAEVCLHISVNGWKSVAAQLPEPSIAIFRKKVALLMVLSMNETKAFPVKQG